MNEESTEKSKFFLGVCERRRTGKFVPALHFQSSFLLNHEKEHQTFYFILSLFFLVDVLATRQLLAIF